MSQKDYPPALGNALSAFANADVKGIYPSFSKITIYRCVEFFGFVPQAPVPRKIKIKVNQTHNEEEFKRRNQRIRNQIDFGLLNLETPAHQKIKKKRKDLKKVPLLACHTCDEKLFKRDSVVCCDTKCQKAFCFICFQKLRVIYYLIQSSLLNYK
jgi:hypothetical protein